MKTVWRVFRDLKRYPWLAAGTLGCAMIAEGLGDIDKSGIAELTFKDRHEHSGGRV